MGKLQAEREGELRILLTQKNQTINQDIVDTTARELELTYRSKELEAIPGQPKLHSLRGRLRQCWIDIRDNSARLRRKNVPLHYRITS